MSIQKKKQEILHLIARVNAPQAGSSPAPTRDRVVGRRGELALTKRRRKDLESEFLDSGFLDVYRTLEQRIEALERIATQRGRAPEEKALPPSSEELGPDVSLTGAIREGVLADVLQLLSSNTASGIFVVLSKSVRLELYFVDGEVIHADGEGVNGESAVFAALAVERGRFFFRETKEVPAHRSITSKTQFLILEALRQIDEARAQGGQEPKP